MANPTRWVITCPDYTTKPLRTREAAERTLAQIEAAGACKEQHAIEEAR